jgi:hypothetical protein
MPRFILRFTGEGAISPDDFESWRSLPNCHVVDQTSRMLLVEAEEQSLRDVVNAKRDWRLTPETTTVRVPDPRPKVKRSPSV